MALINCPECSHRISDKSIACISCGFPIARAAPFRAVPPPLSEMDFIDNKDNFLVEKHQIIKPKKKGKSSKFQDFMGVLLVIFFLYQLATCSDDEPSRVQNSSSDSAQIPMLIAGSSEDGRYHLISHTTDNGIEYVEYKRKGNTEDSYSKMHISCSDNKMKSYSADSINALQSADMGEWYTPNPDWTDKDIFNFICE